MKTQTINLKRTATILQPDQSRVLLRPLNLGDVERVDRVIARILSIPEQQIDPLVETLTAEFSQRHQQVRRMCLERFEQVYRDHIPEDRVAKGMLSEQTRLLIGAYFLGEYSLESAALFNPSIIPHTDQTGLPSGALRFILSLRATGEGHISSITFRTGIIHDDQRIEVDVPAGFLTEPRQIPTSAYEKKLFTRKLQELGLSGDFVTRVLNRLGESFSMQKLRESLDKETNREIQMDGVLRLDHDAANGIWMLAKSNYEVQFEPEKQLSERILFPAAPSQSNGIEDARFVRFRKDDGSHVYYATFTAFDGKIVMPELIETSDFLRFRFITLNGPAAQNKGMAMFPRKIGGRFAMLARQDNESIYLSFSNNIHFWDQHKLLLRPKFSWEMVQIGNCGSPIETEAGWLVLSHGVGPLRKYSIGAFLLDRDDPGKVIGRLREPLIQPNENERKGYVPNVVYTCGALLHNRSLIIPYGLADHATSFATVCVDEVIAAMEPEAGSP